MNSSLISRKYCISFSFIILIFVFSIKILFKYPYLFLNTDILKQLFQQSTFASNKEFLKGKNVIQNSLFTSLCYKNMTSISQIFWGPNDINVSFGEMYVVALHCLIGRNIGFNCNQIYNIYFHQCMIYTAWIGHGARQLLLKLCF